MKHRKIAPVLRHAVCMVGRTIKQYALLSVTIVISFSLLLGYLVYTDSATYNEYKELFAQRRGDFVVGNYLSGSERLNAMVDKGSAVDDTIHYIMYGGFSSIKHTSIKEGEDGTQDYAGYNESCFIDYLPDHAWMVATIASGDIVWTDGKEHTDVTLAVNEVIINEWKYYNLGLDQAESQTYRFRLEDGGLNLTLNVVGYVKAENWELESNYTHMILSTKALDQYKMGESDTLCSKRVAVFHSSNPEQLRQIADTLDYGDHAGDIYYSVFEEQDKALEAIRYSTQNKSLIACAMLLLLGINLYSSFSNALNDRKFEIGVKRAIGASSGSIVRQFLYESLIVMTANIALSVALVTDVFITYKYIYEHTPDKWGNYYEWVIYVNPYSVSMFGICTVTLTVVFGLIFAYKTTQVEIVRYLKAE